MRILVIFLFTLLLIGCGGSGSGDSDGIVSIEGSIEVRSDTNVDQDVEGACTVLSTRNNSLGQAQEISNPLTIGGYLNGAMVELDECDTFELDLEDYYSVSLVSGQSVSLSIFAANDGAENFNVSLELRARSNPDLVVSILEVDEVGAETMTVSATDEYYIRLALNEGDDAVLYTLSLSQSLSTETLRYLDEATRFDFVPGEVIILDAEADSVTARRANAHATAESSNALVDRHSVSFSRKTGMASGLYTFDEFNTRRTRSSSSLPDDDSLLAQKIRTLALIDAINDDSGVLKAEPNYYRRALFSPNDSRYSQQWSLSLLNTEEAWDTSLGSGVVVAVVDSGINPSHPDLQNQLTQDGFDFVSDSEFSGDGDGYDTDPTDLSEIQHGAHVAGIIAAQGNNSEGIAGVSFDSRIMPLRVLGIENEEGVSQGTDADLANAILYAGGISNDSGRLPDRPADIINLSLGGGGFSDTLKGAIEAVVANGVIVIAAAGNEASSQNFYPAAFDGVIAVSSVTAELELSGFSNFGGYIDVAAPGGASPGQSSPDGQRAILSTVSGSNYRQYVGTSMAAPHVAGVAALMKSVNAELDISTFSYALENGLLTDVIGEQEQFGYGLINASKSVAWASGNNSIPAELYFFPKSFSFLSDSTESKLYLSNSGAGSVVVSSVAPVEADDDWLDVTFDSVDEQGLGTYNIEINSAAIPVNTFRKGSLLIDYQVNGEAAQQEVIEVLASNTISGNETVGNLFVNIISLEEVLGAGEGEAIEPTATVSGALEDGIYTYRFTNIPSGEYFVRASTNNDGDQFTFDDGEAKGIYPSFSAIRTITAANEDLSDVDFQVQFYESNLEAADSAIGSASLVPTRE